MKKRNRWYKLENAAKIFPPTSNKYDHKVFRFYTELTEMIEPKCLQFALDETIQEFPLFKSVLKRGIFWYYLETSDREIKVQQEQNNPCDKIESNHLFRVSYYNKRINVEVNHALTDGTGTLDFLKILVAKYLVQRYKLNKDLAIDNISVDEREKDSFKKYYKKLKDMNKNKEPYAYQIKEKEYPEGKLKITELIMPADKMLALSKNFNSTVTIYLTALMIKSIAETMSEREKKKPIVVTIPVNLRKYFPSNTARNFFNVIPVVYHVKEDIELEEIMKQVADQFKNKITKEELTKRMNSMAYFENIFIVRLIPIWIKDIVVKNTYKYTRKKRTITISNVGIVNMPKELEKYISLFGVYSSSDNIHSCVCTYNNKLVFTFASHFINHEIQRNFARSITNEDIEVILNTNIVEEELDDEKVF